ncbi:MULTISPECIES: carboxy terminal-processing peptidase [unclassified Leptospira]|uniref:carboxy terminal-processing peptidase n=1 Tax=unclassified Leptospira TaxID=2633828 RepID=UPI0002BE882B|nr:MULTISPECIES: carboxy terminal-processing peptidase [unclassified Leptospira]EMJ98559.1 peptidase, S41 family [Leptospira sp. B5-022]MCR1794810.1 carboxy terminal-processing peptidase [Leptospira sp. id769339]
MIEFFAPIEIRISVYFSKLSYLRKKEVLLILLLFSISAPAQTGQGSNTEKKVKKVLSIVAEHHYLARSRIQPSLSEEVKRSFWMSLDPQGFYFLKEDLDLLGRRSFRLESEEVGQISSFFSNSLNLFKERLKATEDYLNELEKSNSPFVTKGEFEFYPQRKTVFPKNKEDWKDRWVSYLRYKVLSSKFYSEPFSKKEDFQNGLLASEKILRKEVIQREKERIKNILEHPDGFEPYLESIFLNSILEKFDPHSTFFSASEKQRFESSLSSKGYSFGIVFNRSFFGDTKIERLIPGSPAWRSEKMNRGDRILEVRFPDDKNRTVVTSDFSPGEMESILSGIKTKKAVFKVRKSDGQVLNVHLIQEKMGLEENSISSYILNGKHKIGYLYLPAFYTEWETEGGGCAQDIAKEILKLKRDNIKGLILDLRNNGGGSLEEAIDLAGIFVDQGPLFVQKSSNGELIIIKDTNRGTIYDGPMLVLLNGQSASASEFLASALQNYNRALVIGSPSYGKATSQILLPLEENRKGNSDFLKLTTHLYFGVQGMSHQQKGVIPDIPLPDLSDLSGREKDVPEAIRTEQIYKEITYKKFPDLGLSDIKDDSEDRVDDDPNFSKIGSLSSKLRKKIKSMDLISLDSGDFFEEFSELAKFYEEYQAATRRKSNSFTVDTHSFDQSLEKMDSYTKEINSERKTRLEEDLYIDEAYKIMQDYMQTYVRKGQK